MPSPCTPLNVLSLTVRPLPPCQKMPPTPVERPVFPMTTRSIVQFAAFVAKKAASPVFATHTSCTTISCVLAPEIPLFGPLNIGGAPDP